MTLSMGINQMLRSASALIRMTLSKRFLQSSMNIVSALNILSTADQALQAGTMWMNGDIQLSIMPKVILPKN